MGNAYRNGHVHVLVRRCATCVFRPGNLMSLSPGRLRDLIDANREADSALTCHETLLIDEQAVCRGFFDLEPKTQPLQVAERIGIVTFVDAPWPE